MNVKAKGSGLRVTLSRTNLVGLLAAMDLAGSARTLTQRGSGNAADGYDFYEVAAEEDAAHYGPHTPLAKGGSA